MGSLTRSTQPEPELQLLIQLLNLQLPPQPPPRIATVAVAHTTDVHAMGRGEVGGDAANFLHRMDSAAHGVADPVVERLGIIAAQQAAETHRR
jgi:hypothetical protein